MVDTSGLTRSKGSVSHAGKTSTLPDPPPGVNPTRSWASCSADAPVGVTTSTGRRAPSRTRPARTKAWAGVATARVALDAPMTRVMAGSLRRRAGSERRLTRSGYRGGNGGLAEASMAPVTPAVRAAPRRGETRNRLEGRSGTASGRRAAGRRTLAGAPSAGPAETGVEHPPGSVSPTCAWAPSGTAGP